jgi:hypothetical protein
MKDSTNNRMGTGGVSLNRGDRLIGWGEIADHLQCSTRTARNWQAHGLPVTRAMAGGRVEADPAKLTKWLDR